MSHKVMLIGLGGIGYKYDRNIAQEGVVYTHAKAIAMDKRFELICAVDNDEKLRNEFASKYGVPVFSVIEDALSHESNFDLVIVATPTFTHLNMITVLLEASCAKTILLEKPLAETYPEACSIVELCKAKGVTLFVNYIRCSDQGVREIKNIIDVSWAGKPVKGVCWYSKGWIHNASHFFNLLEYWLGDCNTGIGVDMPEEMDGFINIDARVEFERGVVVFLAAWESAFSYYSIELMSPLGKISYLNGGESIYIQGVKADDDLDGYKALDCNKAEVTNSMSQYQLEVLNQVANFFNGEEYFLCTGENALKTILNMNNVQRNILFNSGDRW